MGYGAAMGQGAVSASRPLALVAAPVLVHQGRRVRRDTPVLPEADGPRRGVEGHREQLALLVLGESTTAGVGVVTQADGLARALAVELAARLARGVAWQVVAGTGTTARSALGRLVPRLGTDRYDMILVALGMNDVLRLRSRRAWPALERCSRWTMVLCDECSYRVLRLSRSAASRFGALDRHASSTSSASSSSPIRPSRTSTAAYPSKWGVVKKTSGSSAMSAALTPSSRTWTPSTGSPSPGARSPRASRSARRSGRAQTNAFPRTRQDGCPP